MIINKLIDKIALSDKNIIESYLCNPGYIIKPTGRYLNNLITIIFQNNHDGLAIAKLSLNYFGELALKKELSSIKTVIKNDGFRNHVPKIIDSGELNRSFFILQEFIQGTSLLHYISKSVYRKKYNIIENILFDTMKLLIKLKNITDCTPTIINKSLFENYITEYGNNIDYNLLYQIMGNLRNAMIKPGIYHGDFCMDNIIVQDDPNANLCLIDWEFCECNFISEFDALFFAISFLETVYFIILENNKKDNKGFLKYLSDDNEFNKMVNRALSFYFKTTNPSLTSNDLINLFILLLNISLIRDSFLKNKKLANKNYNNLINYTINAKSGDIKFLPLS